MGASRRTRLLVLTTLAFGGVASSARPARATDPPAPVTATPPPPTGREPAPTTSTSTTTPEEPDPDLAKSGSPKVLGLTLGATGLVGIGVGSIFGLLSMSSWSNATGGCGPAANPGHCVAKNPAQVTSDHDTAQTDAAISTVTFIVGGILVVAGATVLLTGTHHGGGAAPVVALAPAFGPGQAGFAMSGSF